MVKNRRKMETMQSQGKDATDSEGGEEGEQRQGQKTTVSNPTGSRGSG